MTIASGEIALQNKHDLMCHVAKVKAATSAHSMADVIPFFSVFNIPFESNASIASSADVLLARHAFLPNERLLKRAAHSFPFVPKDQLEITWR